MALAFEVMVLPVKLLLFAPDLKAMVIEAPQFGIVCIMVLFAKRLYRLAFRSTWEFIRLSVKRLLLLAPMSKSAYAPVVAVVPVVVRFVNMLFELEERRVAVPDVEVALVFSTLLPVLE